MCLGWLMYIRQIVVYAGYQERFLFSYGSLVCPEKWARHDLEKQAGMGIVQIRIREVLPSYPDQVLA
jgi:hypothetical protein